MTTPQAPRLIDARLRDEFATLASEESCELLEIELKGGVLRFVIDHPEGITVEHCQAFSKQASAILDVEEFGKGSYVLEVTSPGLDRKLYGPEDYRRFQGQLSRFTYRDPAGKRQTVVGQLEGCDETNGGLVKLRDRETGESLTLAMGEVEKARLEIDL